MSHSAIHVRSEIQRPVGNIVIILSILFALLLNSLPWEGIWLTLRPDFVALVTLYWCAHKPLRLGIGLAWTVGMLADVSDASLFGQHALAYTVLGFGGVMLHHRLKMFDLRQQTTQVFGIFALTYTIYALVQWQMNGYMEWIYFLGCLTSTLFWAPLSFIFQVLRQRRMSRE